MVPCGNRSLSGVAVQSEAKPSDCLFHDHAVEMELSDQEPETSMYRRPCPGSFLRTESSRLSRCFLNGPRRIFDTEFFSLTVGFGAATAITQLTTLPWARITGWTCHP